LESDNIRGAGVSFVLIVKPVIEIGRFVGLKSFVGKTDNLILIVYCIISSTKGPVVNTI